jgi:ABC-type sugar transport system permease subunit
MCKFKEIRETWSEIFKAWDEIKNVRIPFLALLTIGIVLSWGIIRTAYSFFYEYQINNLKSDIAQYSEYKNIFMGQSASDVTTRLKDLETKLSAFKLPNPQLKELVDALEFNPLTISTTPTIAISCQTILAFCDRISGAFYDAKWSVLNNVKSEGFQNGGIKMISSDVPNTFDRGITSGLNLFYCPAADDVLKNKIISAFKTIEFSITEIGNGKHCQGWLGPTHFMLTVANDSE